MYITHKDRVGFLDGCLIKIDKDGKYWFVWPTKRNRPAEEGRPSTALDVAEFLSNGTWKVLPDSESEAYLNPPAPKPKTMEEQLTELYKEVVKLRTNILNEVYPHIKREADRYYVATPSTNTEWSLQVFEFLKQAVDKYGFMVGHSVEDKNYTLYLWGDPK